MTFEDLQSKINEAQYDLIYFLHGKESYFIDTISDSIEEKALTEAEKAFNQTIIYGKEADPKAVIDAARRFPMMAERQLVIIKEAQEMKALKDLERYLNQPAPTTILVICYKHKKFSFSSNFGKLLKKQAVIFEAKPLYDNQVPAWITGYLKQKSLSIKPKASALIAEYLGTNLSKVTNELDKLAINLAKGTEITEQIIEENIGISKDFNVFELQKAIGQRQVVKANRIIQYFASNPSKHPIQMVIGSLYNFFSKLYAYQFVKKEPEKEILSALRLSSSFFLRDYKSAALAYNRKQIESVIHLLMEYDLKSKGVGYNTVGKSSDGLMKEMVWKILHS